MENKKIIVRYPPSPTGIAHIGNIRSFLFSHLVKERENQEGRVGEAVLRFEDTDRERSDKKFENYILKTFEDLKITYNRGPFRQSERQEFYNDAIETLLRNKMAFEGEESKDGTGDRVIRFKNPNKKITFTDKIRGEIIIDTTDFGDFVIARSKTNPLYHLTVVVDDINMGVTDVIRGEDHITSTPRQILLIEALGGIIPNYAHLPLIIGEDKKKLGKRHGAITWQEFKQMGYLPEGVVNYLALLGWHPKKGDEQEIFSIQELVEKFRIEDVSKSPAKFDYKKLNDINKAWMLKLDVEKFYQKTLEFLSQDLKKNFIENEKKGRKICQKILREKISYFGEIKKMEEEGEFDYYFFTPKFEKEKIIFKDDSLENAKKYLAQIHEKISQISEENWTSENIKEKIWDWSGEVGRGNVLHPFRTVLSGKDRSPDPFTISEILGREKTLRRLKGKIL